MGQSARDSIFKMEYQIPFRNPLSLEDAVREVAIPAVGFAMTEALLIAWTKQPGDVVSAGEAVAEIETDKTNAELEAPIDGILGRHRFAPGDVVPVGVALTVILEPGEIETEGDVPAAPVPAAPVPATPVVPAAPVAPAAEVPPVDEPAVPVCPACALPAAPVAPAAPPPLPALPVLFSDPAHAANATTQNVRKGARGMSRIVPRSSA
jgi:pyruvate/2-oxoglutarate dehydrogenase complex dihydrolipoamide acyltransferase (E2) component